VSDAGWVGNDAIDGDLRESEAAVGSCHGWEALGWLKTGDAGLGAVATLTVSRLLRVTGLAGHKHH
jgi:hypothetical protein